jgi:hypothetical protein
LRCIRLRESQTASQRQHHHPQCKLFHGSTSRAICKQFAGPRQNPLVAVRNRTPTRNCY